ncbi:thiamine pyrophosphate-dependent enzyme [Listeria floridensis]|uniref:thiamine pyrophosphate-dependent enzyme n=1 Tax=Listeria floridensis TaxID=1494962 RepID=UPI0004B3A01A
MKKNKLPVTTLNLGKISSDETVPSFIGTYGGALSEPEVQAYVDHADFLLLLGVKLTDSATGAFSHDFPEEKVIALNTDSVRIFGEPSSSPHHFEPLLNALEELDLVPFTGPYPAKKPVQPFTPDETLLTQTRFWEAMASFFMKGDTILAEQGTAFFGAASLPLQASSSFIGQPLWGSIGYTFPAALGSQIANPSGRHILFIGDGSLQLTIQELGLAFRERIKPIIFVINNDGYTVERKIHGAEQAYNDIPMWRYSELPQAFGGSEDLVVSHRVKTETELDVVLKQINADNTRLHWVEVIMPKMDAPEYLQKLGTLFAKQNS